MRKFRDMWGKEVEKYFLWKRTKPSGEITYTIYQRGERRAIVIIDEDDILVGRVKKKMLDAGVAVISTLEEGLERGFFKVV